MKTAETLKERDFEPQFEALLRELLGRVPSLQLASLKKDARVSPASTERADRVAQVVAGDRKWTLVVEEKRLEAVLAKLRASTTDKTQGLTISGLDQSASGTNAVEILHAVTEAAVSAAIKSVTP